MVFFPRSKASGESFKVREFDSSDRFLNERTGCDSVNFNVESDAGRLDKDLRVIDISHLDHACKTNFSSTDWVGVPAAYLKQTESFQHWYYPFDSGI